MVVDEKSRKNLDITLLDMSACAFKEAFAYRNKYQNLMSDRCAFYVIQDSIFHTINRPAHEIHLIVFNA